MPLTDSEFWQYVGLQQAVGDDEIARRAKLTPEELRACVWPGDEGPELEALRGVVEKARVVPVPPLPNVKPVRRSRA